MTEKQAKYPNKADYEPNIDEHIEEKGELPLSDPSETNETKVFRENEAKVAGEEEQSAFGQNKEE